MSFLAQNDMLQYLAKSISSLNRNKLNGLLAEIDFRQHLQTLGFGGNVTQGGWICRSEGAGNFGHNVVALFPETIQPNQHYAAGRPTPNPPPGLYGMATTFHQIGIRTYYCVPSVGTPSDPLSVTWQASQLGLPVTHPYMAFPQNLAGFNIRQRRYNFLRYGTNVAPIPPLSVPEEFSKENLRVVFQTQLLSEISDVDGILYGQRLTYPLEIKEKTVGWDSRMGDFFGLDVGPFVKLAFYTAKRGNLHSLFVVREINDVIQRQLIQWWYITFERLAEFAGWTPMSGGRGMTGSASAVIKIPKAEFLPLTRAALQSL